MYVPGPEEKSHCLSIEIEIEIEIIKQMHSFLGCVEEYTCPTH